jgi:DNA relaxase NicK
MVVGRNGAEIMRVASRQSERYLRIYDKGLDSGDEWYRGALRVELELKGDAAIAYVNELCTKENEQEFFYATIATFLLVRLEIAASADNLRWSALERTLCSNQPPCADVCNTTLSWLANSVQPSIDRLRRAGKLKQALETLGITRDDFEETFSINRATLEHTDSLEGPIC